MEVEFTDVGQEERVLVDREWRAAFSNLVTKKHRNSMSGKYYRWHAFSYKIQPCTGGQAAVDEYRRQFPSPFYVFNEDLGLFVRCTSLEYPDLSGLNDDIYVCHHNMKWTMVFTHEHPHCGPYFAFKELNS